MISHSSAYAGHVVHKRLHPVQHALKYRVFSLLLDVGALEETSRSLRFFSYNRFNIFSLHDRDHGPGDGTAIHTHVQGMLAKLNEKQEFNRVLMLCYPRVLGYVFNPLTIYLALDGSDKIKAVIYEVNNTFGERKSYVLPVAPDQDTGGVIAQTCQKEFYVSPFNKVEGDYGFRVTPPGECMSIGVSLRNQNGPVLKAYFSGRRKALNDRFLIASLFRFPLQTYKVIAGIHFEALKLWLKGLKIMPRPPLPENPVAVFPSSERPGKKSV